MLKRLPRKTFNVTKRSHHEIEPSCRRMAAQHFVALIPAHLNVLTWAMSQAAKSAPLSVSAEYVRVHVWPSLQFSLLPAACQDGFSCIDSDPLQWPRRPRACRELT